ncbi:unnamed protein product [Strongylus vulgaris]|uniref:Uncharacterized protein n=1 Tax=Strongylus vulgaris TaxID=40348 RepID=A0A3P7JI72_STRVU|nr:unnamed protein product [Strongylus vulgaris]
MDLERNGVQNEIEIGQSGGLIPHLPLHTKKMGSTIRPLAPERRKEPDGMKTMASVMIRAEVPECSPSLPLSTISVERWRILWSPLSMTATKSNNVPHSRLYYSIVIVMLN